MIQTLDNNILHSSIFNLSKLCRNIPLYSDSYLEYLDNTYTFPRDPTFIDKFKQLEDEETKIASFSNYLVFNIINLLLDNKTIIKKDVEDYYNSQMLSFLKSQNLLGVFQLKYLANVWNSLNKVIDKLIYELSNYNSSFLNIDIKWSDTLNNYYHTVPYIATKNNEVDVFLILHSNLTKNPLYNKHIDYLKIPSIPFILNSIFIQNIDIKRLKVLWLDSSDITKNFQYLIYRDIPINYIKDTANILNFKNNTSYPYPNINLCSSCPYINFCDKKDLFLKPNTFYKNETYPKELFEHKRNLI